MELTYHIENDIAVLALSGRLDAYEVPTVTKWLEEHPQTKHIIVNLAGVGFIDSSGLATLVKALKLCRQNGGDLYLSNLQQAVLIIFELTRLDKAFGIYDEEAAALRALHQAKETS
jgi:anti-sigma B factor antagonist